MSDRSADPLRVLAAIGEPGWLVGGALRDRLLGRPTADYDVVMSGRPAPVARQLARRVGGHPFELSHGFGVWRVISRDRTWQVDLLPLADESIEGDLAKRDLTVNAIAQPLGEERLIDPFGGARDLEARRLRMVTSDTFARDPLRTLRLARLACELGFSIERETGAVAAQSAPALSRVAPERIFAELKRVVSSERPVEGLRTMNELGIVAAVLPELGALEGIEQSPYHHLDVYEHTLAVLEQLIELERDPEPVFGSSAGPIDEFLAQPLANELSRWQALRFGALLHDIAKPRTRQITDSGRVTFIGHDSVGADMAVAVFTRLRASERLGEHVAALTRNHLRLGFMVHEMPASRRAIYRYLRASAPVQIDVTALSVADRLATRGSAVGTEAIARHLELARELLDEALRWIAEPPQPPLRGDELTRALGLTPGPQLGLILAELEEASFAREIGSREQALERARELLGEGSTGSRR